MIDSIVYFVYRPYHTIAQETIESKKRIHSTVEIQILYLQTRSLWYRVCYLTMDDNQMKERI